MGALCAAPHRIRYQLNRYIPPGELLNKAVIPAKAGIQFFSNLLKRLDSSLRWNDEQRLIQSIPSFFSL